MVDFCFEIDVASDKEKRLLCVDVKCETQFFNFFVFCCIKVVRYKLCRK